MDEIWKDIIEGTKDYTKCQEIWVGLNRSEDRLLL